MKGAVKPYTMMRAWKRFLVLCLWSVAVPFGAFAASLTELDRIQDEAVDLKTFLSSPSLVERYYEAAAAYYGKEKFSREAFNAVLQQMWSLSAASPTFAQQAWRKDDLPDSYQVKSEIGSYGRRLNQPSWNLYFSNWQADLSSSAQKYFGDQPSQERLAKIVEGFDKELKTIDEKLAGEELSQRLKIEKRAAFYKEFSARQDVVATIAAALKSKFAERDVVELMKSGDADFVLDTLDDLRTNKAVSLGVELSADSRFASFIRSRVPNVEKLLENKQIFPDEMVGTRKGVVAIGRSKAGGCPYSR